MVVGAGGTRAAISRTRGAGVGCKPPVPPVAIDRFAEFLVQPKASPREVCQWRAVTPVEGQKASGFAGGRAGDPGPFDDDRHNATTAQEIGDRGPDYAAATDDNPHAPSLRLWV